MDGNFSGRHLVEALKFVLLACPKETEENNGDSSYVVFSGNRIISGDGFRWHIAYLEDTAKMRPTCATRASVQALRDVLGGVKKSVGKEGTFKVRVEGLMVDVTTDDEPMIRTLAPWRSGSWPEGWEPTVPDGLEPADTSRVDGKFLREAASWKDSTAVFAGDAQGPVRVDSYVGNTLVSRAVLLTIDSPAADTSDARQTQMFPEKSRPAESVGRVAKDLREGFEKIARETGAKITIRAGGKETVVADGTKSAHKPDEPLVVGGVEVKLPTTPPATTADLKETLRAAGIEQRPAPATDPGAVVTVFYVTAERSEEVEHNTFLANLPWAFSSDGKYYECPPCLPHDADDVRRASKVAEVALGERVLKGRWASDFFELIAPRAQVEKLDALGKHALKKVSTAEDKLVVGEFVTIEQSDVARWDTSISAEGAAAVQETAKRLGVDVTIVRDVLVPCASCGKVQRSTLLAGAMLCRDKTCVAARAGAKSEKPAKAPRPKKGERSVVELEAVRDKLKERIKSAASGAGLASAWVDVLGAKLPAPMQSFLAGYWTEAATALHLTEDTLSALRRRGEAPAATLAEQFAGA